MLLGDNPKFLKWLGYLGAFIIFLLFIGVSATYPDRWSKYAILVGLVFACAMMLGWAVEHREQQKKLIAEAEIRELQAKADSAPEKAGPAWDLARVKLENYFDRNLDQVKSVFYVAIFVMVSGFLFVLWGIRIAVLQPDHVPIALMASASGIITQFIGLTFMVIYRSTMAQANEFVGILERINTVGMAVQILDSMSASSPQLKDETRAAIIKLLLAASGQNTAVPAEMAAAAGQGRTN